MNASISLGALFQFHTQPQADAIFWVQMKRNRSGALSPKVQPAAFAYGSARGKWAVPTPLCGDAPDKYHPLYAFALLGTQTFLENWHSQGAPIEPEVWLLPAISFSTDEWTRRSMTLNAMRMSTEFYASGSERVLQLVESRLAVGQRDVVHDVLVYNARLLLDAMGEADEASLLRSESVAAYLGLQRAKTDELFRGPLVSSRLTAKIEAGYAGVVRRKLDVGALIESQLQQLKPVLAALRFKQARTLSLLDAIAAILHQ